MATYRIDGARSRIEVCARSSIHDTRTTWDQVSGTIEADAVTLAEAGATARIEVDMRKFDAGDWLRNRKLKKDLAVDAHPTATFALARVREVSRRADGGFDARAEGTLSWRGRQVAVRATGSGRIDAGRLEAEGAFDLDVRDLGVTPPRFLMLKVEEVVSVRVVIRATSS
jgi:polyisoprenoid-binding protein YceI